MGRNNWTEEQLFTRLLHNKSEKAYWENMNVLRAKSSEYIFSTCVEWAHSQDPKKRLIAINVLDQLGGRPRPFYKESIELFFELLETEDVMQNMDALFTAIAHNNHILTSKQVEKLCSFRDIADHKARFGLVWALLTVKHPLAVKTLIALSNDKFQHIRNWATFGLGSQIDTNTISVRKALWARVNEKHQETRYEAIVGLAKRKVKEVASLISKELMKGEYGTLLFEAIIELGDKQFLPILREHYAIESVNENINSGWLKDLGDCIEQLEVSF